MNLQANLLAVIGAEATQFIERLADLLDRLFLWHVLGQIVRFDFDARAAAIAREYDVLFRTVNFFFEPGRIGIMKGIVRPKAHQRYGAVVETFFHLLTLSGVEIRFDAVGVLGAQLDT